jgi:replicative DNA helicase
MTGSRRAASASPSATAAPHSLDAERAVLGALLVRPDAWADIRDIVSSADFWRAAHRTLFRRMSDLVAAGRAIDLVTLAEVLERHSEVEEVGGLAYVAGLSDAVVRTSHAVHYAEIVREKAKRRQLLVLADQIRAEAVAADDVEDVRQRTEEALRTLDAGPRGDFLTSEQAAHAALDELEHAREAHGLTGIPTGLPTIDRTTGGLQTGDLVVLAARPSVGKTAAAGQWAMYAALERRVPTLFVTLEQRASQLALRMASNRTCIDLVAVRDARAQDQDLSRLNRALEQLADAPLTFLDSRDLRMSDVRRHARLLTAQGKCGLLFLDYLTLLQPEPTSTRAETREAQVAAQSRMAKSIARELGIPVVLLCQLNREFERDSGAAPGVRRSPRSPRLSDLRESGAIEQDADLVVFIHRPFVRPTSAEERAHEGETDLLIAKNRNGPIGRVRARYHKAWVRFEEVDDQSGGD